MKSNTLCWRGGLMACVLFLAIAARGRADERDDRLAKELVDVLRDPKVSIWARAEAAKTLGRLGPSAGAAVPGMTAILGKMRPGEQVMLQEAIIRALGLMGHPAKPALPALARAAGQNVDIDRAIGTATREIVLASDLYDLPALITQLTTSRDETLRLRAAKAIARLGPLARSAVPDLAVAMTDPDPDVRRAAIQAIRTILPNEKPTEQMIRAYALDLQDPDPTVRLSAVTILGKLGPAASVAIPAMEAVLDDPDRDVKRAAIEAMNRINPP